VDLSIIRERMGQYETLKKENKIAREALKNELENNTEYLKVCEEVEAMADKKKRVKEAIWARVETQKIIMEIKDNNEELSTLEEILSAELTEYYTEKRIHEIQDADGVERTFKLVAKIQPKKEKADDRDFEGKYTAKIDPAIIESGT
jgi:hypothetical protein